MDLGAIPMYDASKVCARIDLKKLSTVAEVELGETVTITITGKVKSMRGPEEGLRPVYGEKGKTKKEEKYTYNGNLEVEIEQMVIKSVGDFDGMADD